MRSPFSLSLLALVFAAAAPLGAQTTTLRPVVNGMRIEIDGQLFTEYNVKDVPRPFLYPIIGGAGENVVRNFPMVQDIPGEAKDHKHHRGLWFAHGSVNDMDFWSEEKDFGRQEHVEFKDISAKENKASFVADTKWVAPNGKVQLTDSRKITVTALPGGEKYVDFDITLKATEGDVVFGDTKEGTMAIRLSPGLSMKGEGAAAKAYNSGTDKNKAIWGKRANWVAYYGPDPKGNVVGVVMFEHPKNFRAPTWWHARDYGLFAANPFGIHDFEEKKDQEHLGDHKLAKGESLALRYRFYFTKGKPMPTPLAAKFTEYSAE
ncbi:MAG: PmoA family protein [Verrucomicrobium sp.]